jgi:hypothetical protein
MKKIEFFSSIPGVSETFPIIPSKEIMPRWVADCRENYKTKLPLMHNVRSPHTYRCPGIFDILKEGYYVTLPWDVTIETRGDSDNFKWIVPSSELSELMGDTPLVLSHTAAGANMPKRQGEMNGLIKLNTPWQFKMPKGMKLLMLPLSYSETLEFEHVPGILDPGYSTDISLMIRWYKPSGSYTIKAGTPIAHLIPLTDQKLGFECRDANAWDNLWIQKKKFLNNFSYVVQRNKIKDAYNRHWSNK